jgi:hypothetical protein
MLEDEEWRFGASIQFDGIFVVPLNDAVDRLTVLENNDHRRLVLHLLHVIEILRIRGVILIGRTFMIPRRLNGHLFFDLGKAWPNQLAI